MLPGRLTRSDTTLHYWSLSGGRGPTVVLIHGATLDHDAFADQVPVLAQAGYPVVSWDMRGHGASRPMGAHFSIATAADDLAALLDEVDAAQAVLVGQSFGGFVVQELYRHHPERVCAMVLVGTPPATQCPIIASLPRHHRVLNRLRPALLRHWPEWHLRRVMPSFMSRHAEVREYVARATQPMSRSGIVRVTEAALQALTSAGEPLTPHVPTLFVYGAEEPNTWVVPLVHGLAARNPDVETTEIPDAGHLPNQENPDAFNERLLRFLAGVAARAAAPTYPSATGR